MGCKCLGCPKWGKEDVSSPDDSGTMLKSDIREAASTRRPASSGLISAVGDRGTEMIEARRVDSPLAVSERDTILRAIRPLLPFQHLPYLQLEWVAKSMQRYSLSPGQLVFAEGAWAQGCYVLGSGTLKVEREGKQIAILKAIDTLGDDSLLITLKRTITVTANTAAVLWGIDKHTFKSYIQASSSAGYEAIRALVTRATIFACLSPLQMRDIVQIASFVSFPQDTVIITEGYRGEVCYVIKTGTVSCIQSGSNLTQLTTGDYFGDQALLYGGKRTSTVVAVTELDCVAIRREDLEVVFRGNLQNVLLRNTLKLAIAGSKELGKLSEVQVETIVEIAELSSWEKGDTLVYAETPRNQGMWVVISGKVESEDHSAGNFTCIGASDLISRSSALYSASLIIASDTADIAYFSASALESALNAALPIALLHGQVYTSLLQSSIFRLLPSSALWRLTQTLRSQAYTDKQVLAPAHSRSEYYYILQSGTVRLEKEGKVVRLVGDWECLGDLAVVGDGKWEVSAVAQGPVVCWVGSREDLQRVLGASLVKWLKNRCYLMTFALPLTDLIVLKTLETGPFGPTLLVQNSNRLYELKVIERHLITQAVNRQTVLQERKIRGIIEEIGFARLIRTYKDDFRLYFLIEHIRNVPFSALLDRFPESSADARFYISAIIILLISLHSRNILLRSLSPSTIFVDSEGYPCLSDLSSAKVVPERTYTMVGSPHYMAPEVILGTGYSQDADYWSLGVITYQCLYGKLPFGEGISQPIQIYDKVLNSKLKFPANVDIGPAKSLIETLLSRNPPLRHYSNPAKLRNHPWLSGLNWVIAS